MANALKITLDDKTYLFSEDTSDNIELVDLEELTGWALGELVERLAAGSMKAVTALVWILRRRDEPGLAFRDVRFKTSDLALEFLEDDPGNDEGRSPVS